MNSQPEFDHICGASFKAARGVASGVSVMLLLLVVVVAQTGAEPPDPLKPSDTSSPRATFESFLDACNELYAIVAAREKQEWDSAAFLPATERVLDCLDLSELPTELRGSAGVESAVFLKETLDRIELPSATEIPGAEQADDPALPSWRIPGTRLAIAQVESGPHRGEFQFTPETVRKASSFFQMARSLPYRDKDPEVSREFHDLYLAATKSKPKQTADTASPRGTLSLFLTSVNQIYSEISADEFLNRSDPKHTHIVQQALQCLDISELPEYSREYHAQEAVVCIKEVLDRISLPPSEEVPGVEMLEGSSAAEKLTQWQVPTTRLTIGLVEEGPRRGAYLFTPETVRLATEFYEKVRLQPYRTDGNPVSEGLHDWWLSAPGSPPIARLVNQLPARFRSRVFGLAGWQWIGLVLVLLFAAALMYGALRVGQSGSAEVGQLNLVKYWLTWPFQIAVMLVPLLFKYVAYEHLTIRGRVLYSLVFAADVTFLLALIIVVWGGCNRITETIVIASRTRGRRGDAQLIRIIGRLVSVVAAIILFLEGGRYLGFPLTTLLASAGIGGLAVALAGQSMLKGLFGTLTIMVDMPFREGERILVKGHDGFVEEIGLRSTKIRTFLTNHLVSIPNDQMADNEIENIGRRAHIRRMSDIHLPIDTSREKVERALTLIRSVLENHDGMDPEYPPRVHFNEFNPDSFNIQIIYWFRPADLWQFCECSERINLKIFRLFEEHGIQFSLPLRHSYWKQDAQQGPLEVSISRSGAETAEPHEASPPETPRRRPPK